ncbi:MAG: nucleoside hydrolase [Asticcacaulis sp.]
MTSMTNQSASRRNLLLGGLMLTAAGLLPNAANALTVKKRQRVIIDNDFSGDPDGLFQLAHHLASPSIEIPLIIGSHIHVKDFIDGSETQADNAVRYIREVCSRMKLVQAPEIVAGYNQAPAKGALPQRSNAAQKIIAEAMRTDTKLPLFYTAGAGLTEIAEALKLEPEIGKRMKLVWIGGMEHNDLTPEVPVRRSREYNMMINLPAAQTVFNDSDIEIWQVPRNVYRQLNISHAELIEGLKPSGALGEYLLAQLDRVINAIEYNLGETYIMGDNPLVTLTALQSSFDADSSSSNYVVRPTPRLSEDGHRYEPVEGGRPMRIYTSIDTRLTFADMFAKFAAAAI